MFNRKTDEKVAILVDSLMQRLNDRMPYDSLQDANFNWEYGQFDGVVSNIYAQYYRDRIKLALGDHWRLKRLVDLLGMRREIEELRHFIDREKLSPDHRRLKGMA